MSAHGPGPGAVVLGVFLTASAITAATAAVVGVRRTTSAHRAAPTPPPVAAIASPVQPIPAEAYVFRTNPGMLALGPAAERERSAHPRRLSTMRFLRAFPGAPPRIPHGLTADEFRTDGCRTCHQRGGFSVRFSAYVPVTPHPERGICTQCHLGVDSVMGMVVADADPNARCPMCHSIGGGKVREGVSLTWETTVWPPVVKASRGDPPPPIPHGLQFRENCLTCHAGPAAVAELRTPHPERVACRQCHLAPSSETAEVATTGGAE